VEVPRTMMKILARWSARQEYQSFLVRLATEVNKSRTREARGDSSVTAKSIVDDQDAG